MSSFTPFEDKLDWKSTFNGSFLSMEGCLKPRERWPVASKTSGASHCFSLCLPHVCPSRLRLPLCDRPCHFCAQPTPTLTLSCRVYVNWRVELNPQRRTQDVGLLLVITNRGSSDAGCGHLSVFGRHLTICCLAWLWKHRKNQDSLERRRKDGLIKAKPVKDFNIRWHLVLYSCSNVKKEGKRCIQNQHLYLYLSQHWIISSFI